MKKIENNNLYIQLVLGVLLLGLLGFTSNYYFQKNAIELNALYNVPYYEKKFFTYVDDEAKTITSFLELIKEKTELQEFFKNRNRDKLYEKALPIFEHLNKNNDITHFYFIKPDGEVLLRVHDKPRFSDIVKRYTFLKSKETLAPFHGLEFGLKKNYTLRVVHPYIVDGNLIGFIEIGKEVDKVINILTNQLGIELYFAVNKSVFDNAPEFVTKRMKNVYKTDSKYIVYKTNDIPKNINYLLNDKDEIKWVKLENKVFISHKNILKDVSGESLGETLYLVDITKDYSEFKTILWSYGTIMTIGTFFMLLIGFFFSKKFQNKITFALHRLKREKKKVEDLSEEQKHLLSLFDKGDSILFKWNNDSKWSINYVSDNVFNLLGYSKKEFLDSDVIYSNCIYQDDVGHVFEEVDYAVKQNLDFLKHKPYRLVTKSGSIKWIIDYTVTQKDEYGNIKYFIGYIVDITDQKEQEYSIRNKLQKLIDTQNSIVLLTDGKSIKFVNKTFLEYFGYANLDDFKKDYRCICDRFIQQDNFFHLENVKENEDNWIDSLLNLSGRQRVVSMQSCFSEAHAFSVSISNYEDNDYVVNFSDISDNIIEKLELKKEASFDELTKLYNRIYFNKNIKNILQAHKNHKMKTGVIFFDIDHFKKFNDTYGHDVGDLVLSKVASLAKKYTRDDDIVIRWGGEEFIIITQTDKIESLYQMSEHLRAVIEAYKFKNINSVTCSFGCAIHNSSKDISDTIKIADEKLYIAKDSGRNRVEI